MSALEHLFSLGIGGEPFGSVLLMACAIAISFGVIAKGGDIFTDGALAIARFTGIPTAIVGATIVCLATTLPEVVVSLTSVIGGSPDFATGSLLGSCCCNLGLILGVGALLGGYRARSRREADEPELGLRALRMPWAVLLGSTLFLWTITARSRSIHAAAAPLSPASAGTLLLVVPFYIAHSLRALRAKRETAIDAPPGPSIATRVRLAAPQFGMFLVGAAMVLVGARVLVVNSAAMAKSFGFSEITIGATVLAIGASIPELTVVIASTLKGRAELGVGSLLGASILNVCLGLGLCASFFPVPISDHSLTVDIPFLLAFLALLAIFARRGRSASMKAGAALLATYGVYLVVLLVA